VLDYESNAPGPGRVEILLPPGMTPSVALFDGKNRALPTVRTVGADRYAVIETGWGKHSLELALR
jgi:hypothetical protein